MAVMERPQWGAIKERLLQPKNLALGVAILLVVVLFWDAMGNLWSRWGGQQELSHSYFIPILSAWLIYQNRDVAKKSLGDPSMIGVGMLVLSGLLLLLGELSEAYVVQHFALVVAIGGLTAAFGGLSLFVLTWISIAHLFFAVPPPYWLITVLSWKFQLMSSVLGVAMIEAMGIPVFLSGNIIDLGEHQLEVAEACSGLRYLFPFISIGVIAAYLFRGPLWQKLIIVFATVPITIIMNSFRVALTAALVQAYGIQHAEGILHYFEGWVVFLMCLAALYGVAVVVAKLDPRFGSALDRIGAPPLTPVKRTISKVKPVMVMGAALSVLLATFAISRTISVDTMITPDRKDYAGLPAEFPGWRTKVQEINPFVAEVLAADDAIVMDLLSPEGDYYNLYTAYLAAREDGRAWHSPRQCIPGGGWRIESHTVLEYAEGAHFNRLIIENRGSRQLLYYWYDQRGRMMANEFVMKGWLLYDSVVKSRSDGAMVRLMTSLGDGETLGDADARLREMMGDVKAILPPYIPE